MKRMISLHWMQIALPMLLAATACSDANLYGKGIEVPSANRVGITGRVCTDDPKKTGFPVRVVFIVDKASGPLFSDYDPEMLRTKALKETLAIQGGNASFSFAVIGMGPVPTLLAPNDGYFTRNPGELDNAVAMTGLAQGCIGEMCRDYAGSIRLARSLIEGEMSDMMKGERSRTQFVVIFMAGGPPSPLGQKTWEEAEAKIREQILKLRSDIEEQGAAALSFHTLHLATKDTVEKTAHLLQEIAFAGAGRFERFNVADSITLDRIDLLRLSGLFSAKSIMVSNVNVLPGPQGPVKDSDADGLNDEIEIKMGTSTTSADTDGDGISDMVESLIVFDPLKADPKPDECSQIQGPPYLDQDFDRLNDCEELLLGTDFSLTDSDGDAIPDWTEVAMGIDYLRDDAISDSDWDGVSNSDEAKVHTDPRANDAAAHLGEGYRYNIVDDGIEEDLSIKNPVKIQGVSVLFGGDDSTPGLGELIYTTSPAMLRWRDPGDDKLGPEVKISDVGRYQIPSSSFIETDEALKKERWLTVDITPGLLPPTKVSEYLLIQKSERHCLSFTFRNIRVMETDSSTGETGLNNIFIYFAEAPTDHIELPGLFRVAHIPVRYHKKTGRIPDVALIEIDDSDFMTVGF